MRCSNCRAWLVTCGTAGNPCIYTQARRKARQRLAARKKRRKAAKARATCGQPPETG